MDKLSQKSKGNSRPNKTKTNLEQMAGIAKGHQKVELTKKPVHAPATRMNTPNFQCVDNQISDLENRIKRLQDEIAQMTSANSKPIEEEDIPSGIPQYDVTNDTIHEAASHKTDDAKHIYPVIVKYTPKFIVEPQELPEKVNSQGHIMKEAADNFSDVRTNFSEIFGSEKIASGYTETCVKSPRPSEALNKLSVRCDDSGEDLSLADD